MKRFKKGISVLQIAASVLSVSMISTNCISPIMAEEFTDEFQSGAYQKDGKWYYGSTNDTGEKLTFEKVTHPTAGAGQVDGLMDSPDQRDQSYAWSAIEYGDYLYIGTCYNSTYGIYWRNVYQMMQTSLHKTPQEASQIANRFVQFVFNDRFPENLGVRGTVLKLNKKTGEVTEVDDSKHDADGLIKATNCSGYRMAFEKDKKLYFVAMGNPTMFLLEIDPENGDKCEIAFKRGLSEDGKKKQISAGMHGLIVYDDEIIMCFAGEQSQQSLDTESHREGGMIVASKDGRNWRTIADEDDLGPSAYHTYDGLMGGGIWDVIEYNGHLYVTVVRDLTNKDTGVVNKTGFAMYKGTKQADGSFTWEKVVGENAALPNGLGCNYAMACNLWVYNGYLYLGTYNDPMLDFTAVADRGDFKDLYNELFYSINLYRMDSNGNFELVCGKPNASFPTRIGNLGDGLGDHGNQYVWRMGEHDGKLWIGTYDATVLASAFTQLTDGQLLDMPQDEYNKRLDQLNKFLGALGVFSKSESMNRLFMEILGSNPVRELFNSLQQFVDSKTGKEDPVIKYLEFKSKYEQFKNLLNHHRSISLDEDLPLEELDAFEEALENAEIDLESAEFDIENESAVTAIFSRFDALLSKIEKPLYYFGCNYYLKNSQKGFDLLYSEDGVNFTAVTRDGFGDESNHGARTINSCNNGTQLYVGTANPFYGAQMWRTVSKDNTDQPDNPDPDNPKPDNPDPDKPKPNNPGGSGSSSSAGAKDYITLYRVYNPNSGEHFYTQDLNEKKHLISLGWNDEGIGWTSPKKSQYPVYRLYNPNAGDHHYTKDKAERDFLAANGWKDEGIGWYSLAEKQGVEVYRQYNPNAAGAGAHNYTTNKTEHDFLVSVGWNGEGVAWWAVK